MRFIYCPICGNKLTLKNIGDDGLTPYCNNCQQPRFDMFSSCVITLVINKENKVALLKQNYISTEYRTLVSGYIVPGETAEEAARREVQEELGMNLTDLQLIQTVWFNKKGMLMIAFMGYTDETEFHISDEVDEVGWFSAEEAVNLVHPISPESASSLLVERYLKELKIKAEAE